ncbi:lipoprotein signal peptidase [Spirochaetia bacterium]|nr:lipoprotein signal peptidase [Spirochaetia bacterium]
MNNKKEFLQKLLPFSLTVFVILLDQITKTIIAVKWPENPQQILDVFNNDFLCIYHVRNKVIAFSLGQGLPSTIRPVLFIVLPLAVLIFLGIFYWRSPDFTKLQRWAVTGILGGGIGNLLDRIFRPDGVVDFVSVNFYGFLGFDRWPTFNIADSAVVVCVILWLVTILFAPKAEDGGKKVE